MGNTDSSKSISSISTSAQVLIGAMNSGQTVQVHATQEYCFLTVEAVKLFLHERQQYLSIKSDILSWTGIFLSLLASIIFSDFKPVLGINKEYVFAVFLVSAAFSVLKIFRYLIIYYSKIRPSLSIDGMSEDLGKKGIIIKAEAKGIFHHQDIQGESSDIGNNIE